MDKFSLLNGLTGKYTYLQISVYEEEFEIVILEEDFCGKGDFG